MSQSKKLKQLEKFISYVLGRRPDEFGLLPDSNGYVKIKEFLKSMSEEEGWKHLRTGHLEELIISIPHPPNEMNDHFIRATDRLNLIKTDTAEKLLKILYTAIRKKAHPYVVQKGLFLQGAEYVILSVKKEMAERIGKRKASESVLLSISTNKADDEGFFFTGLEKNFF